MVFGENFDNPNYMKPSMPATRRLCPNECGRYVILSLDGKHFDCKNCGKIKL